MTSGSLGNICPGLLVCWGDPGCPDAWRYLRPGGWPEVQGQAETRGPSHSHHVHSGLALSGREGLREACMAHGTVIGAEVNVE